MNDLETHPSPHVLGQTVRAYVGNLTNSCDAAPPPLGRGVADHLELRPSSHVTLPNVVVLRQTARGQLRRSTGEI